MSLRFYLLSICFYACTHVLLAQTSFTLTPDTVVAIKPKNSLVMYNYSELTNLTGDSLPMRWVRASVQMEQNGNTVDEFGDWDLGIYDPSHIYLLANKMDSADFVLKPITDTNDKFILHLSPNNVAGHLRVRFRVFPIANPADSASVVFDYTSTEISSASHDLATAIGLEVFPNPASEWLNLRNTSPETVSLTWVSTIGLPMETTQLLPGETKRTDLQMKAPGLWWLLVEKGGRHFVLPQVVGSQ